MIGRYIFNLGYALDVLLNALAAGDPRETVSSRLGKSVEEGHCSACKYVCMVLNVLFLEKDHCKAAINRAHGDWSDDDRGIIK